MIRCCRFTGRMVDENRVCCLMCRNSLRQLDEMTDGLRRRLLAGREVDEQAADSESAVPLSTSSALMTAGSTLPDGTWELTSVSHVALEMMVSTGGSAAAGDAVTELMRRTLERTGSSDNCIVEDVPHSLPSERRRSLGDGDTNVRNPLRDKATEILLRDDMEEQQNPETGASCDVVHYNDSLKNAQMLLEQLNEMMVGGSRPLDAGSDRHVDSPVAVGCDEEGMQEDDTFANIWALRQSTGRDEADVESLDSTIPPNELDESYISPRALNDVDSNHDDSCSAASHTANDDLGGGGDVGDKAELAVDRNQQMSVSGSGDTWFIDTHDAHDIDSMVASEIHHRLSESGDDRLSGAVSEVIQVPATNLRSPGRPLLHSSPASLAQSSPGFTSALSNARKSRSRRTAVQRHEQMYHEQQIQYVSSASDSNSGSDDFVAISRLRHQRLQNSHHEPQEQPTASRGDDPVPVISASSPVVDDKVEDVIEQEIPVTADQDIEVHENEPQSARTAALPVQPVNQDSLAVNDGDIVSNEQVLNSHHSASDEDLYPSELHSVIVHDCLY